MIIDKSYFLNGQLFIPNANDGNAGSSIESNLDNVIERYERQLLLGALGVSLYKELEQAMGDFPNAAQKWKDLVDGVDYTVDQTLYRWEGLRGTDKDGALPCYVYCQYLRQDEINYSTTGMSRNAVANELRASFTEKYVAAWSDFIQKYQGEGFDNRSLCQFLEDRSTDYPYDNFKTYDKVNRFSI